ncbi:MAG: helix-hairpin-helix domain-containing protein, partial [Clostridia bacterium]|nr:helix-hairpin-helix domain-containing protein [Clostridia bacterium]
SPLIETFVTPPTSATESTVVEDIISDSTSTSYSETEATSVETVQIYICGAVEIPGVYSIPNGSILNDIILLAGGMTDSAAVNKINLVYILTENITVYIPTLQEINTNEYDCQTNKPGIIIGGNDNNVSSENSESENGLININTADRNELTKLPGIGEATADKIIRYRETKPFENKEELMNVSGIGEAKYEALKDYICV